MKPTRPVQRLREREPHKSVGGLRHEEVVRFLGTLVRSCDHSASNTHQVSSYLGSLRRATAMSSTVGASYLSPTSRSLCPQIASRTCRSMPAREARRLKVCRHAWTGLMLGSVTPRDLTHSASFSLAFTHGARIGLNGSETSLRLPFGS